MHADEVDVSRHRPRDHGFHRLSHASRSPVFLHQVAQVPASPPRPTAQCPSWSTEAVREALAEDREDLATFDKRAAEPEMTCEERLDDLRASGERFTQGERHRQSSRRPSWELPPSPRRLAPATGSTRERNSLPVSQRTSHSPTSARPSGSAMPASTPDTRSAVSAPNRVAA